MPTNKLPGERAFRPLPYEIPLMLKGTQTAFARPMVPPPPDHAPYKDELVHPVKHPVPYFDAYCSERMTKDNPRGMGQHWCWWTRDNRQGNGWVRCPYGIPGTILWFQEKWLGNPTGGFDETGEWRSTGICRVKVYYAADGVEPGYHQNGILREQVYFQNFAATAMPRWASRYGGKLTNIRAIPMAMLNNQDAIALGVLGMDNDWLLENFPEYAKAHAAWEKAGSQGRPPLGPSMVQRFACLWNATCGKEPGMRYHDNPWIWLCDFQGGKWA